MINRMTRPISLLSFGLALFLLHPATVEAKRPYYEEEREPRRFRLLRPKMDAPDRQLAYANELREAGRRRGARRQYRALVRYWPNTPEAAHAQYARAQLLEERGRLFRASEEYATLLENYTGMVPHAQVLERKFEIAETIREQRRARFLIFPGFHAPERAIPVLESIVEHGPRWERAPDAQLLIGQIKEDTGKLEEAIIAYDRVEFRYPRSPQVEEAAFGKARALYQLSQEYPNHVDGAETAMHALAIFVRNHPDSEHAPEAREYMRTLYDRLARIKFEKARYYDRIARAPKAAITSYELFLEEFPDSVYVDFAERRLETLRAKVGEKDEG